MLPKRFWKSIITSCDRYLHINFYLIWFAYIVICNRCTYFSSFSKFFCNCFYRKEQPHIDNEAYLWTQAIKICFLGHACIALTYMLGLDIYLHTSWATSYHLISTAAKYDIPRLAKFSPSGCSNCLHWHSCLDMQKILVNWGRISVQELWCQI